MLNIDELRNLCQDECIVITKHARNRLHERDITVEDIKNAIRTGGIIKQYEDDLPFPSCLLLGESERETAIHVVVSTDNGYLYIITAYYPDEDEWRPDLKARRER